MKTIAIIICLSMVGCMGTAPRLVDSYQYGDEKKSCVMLYAEIDSINTKIQEKYSERESKVAGNAVLGVVGALVFFPSLFFMDVKSDELAEINALLDRRQNLFNIMADKCPETLVVSNDQFLTDIGKKAPGDAATQTATASDTDSIH